MPQSCNLVWRGECCRNIPAEDRYGREPDKVKSLAQYLAEYFEHELTNGSDYRSHHELFEQAIDAYESTENVKIRIERV